MLRDLRIVPGQIAVSFEGMNTGNYECYLDDSLCFSFILVQLLNIEEDSNSIQSIPLCTFTENTNIFSVDFSTENEVSFFRFYDRLTNR